MMTSFVLQLNLHWTNDVTTSYEQSVCAKVSLFHFYLFENAHCTVVLGGPKLGKKFRTFQQISDTKSCGYVRNLVRFGANKKSLEMGRDGYFL